MPDTKEPQEEVGTELPHRMGKEVKGVVTAAKGTHCFLQGGRESEILA